MNQAVCISFLKWKRWINFRLNFWTYCSAVQILWKGDEDQAPPSFSNLFGRQKQKEKMVWFKLEAADGNRCFIRNPKGIQDVINTGNFGSSNLDLFVLIIKQVIGQIN